MPLYHQIKPQKNISIILWKIRETEEGFRSYLQLSGEDLSRLNSIHHPKKRLEFLAIRACLQHFFGDLPQVLYYPTGKPYLTGHFHVSFSHTHGFAGVILSENHLVGIDLEIYRDKVLAIAPKFLRPEEQESIEKSNRVEHTLLYWGAKECMLKMEGDRKLDFRKNLVIKPFNYDSQLFTEGIILLDDEAKKADLFFEKKDDLYITYGWINN